MFSLKQPIYTYSDSQTDTLLSLFYYVTYFLLRMNLFSCKPVFKLYLINVQLKLLSDHTCILLKIIESDLRDFLFRFEDVNFELIIHSVFLISTLLTLLRVQQLTFIFIFLSNEIFILCTDYPLKLFTCCIEQKDILKKIFRGFFFITLDLG